MAGRDKLGTPARYTVVAGLFALAGLLHGDAVLMMMVSP